MTTIPVIRKFTYSHIVSALERMNVDVERTMARHNTPDWRHIGEADLIPVMDFMKAFEAGARATGEERFSMLVSENLDLDDFLDFGQAVKAGHTVFDAMNIACRLVTSQAPSLKFWLSQRKTGYLLCRKQLVATPDLSPALVQIERYTLRFLLSVIRTGAGPAWTPPQVYLSSERDDLFGEWSEFSDASIEFCAPHSAIFVPNEILVLPICKRDERVLQKNAIAKKRLSQYATGRDFVHDLRDLTKSLLHQNTANLHTLKEVTLLSPRTIQRRLAAKGQTFQSVLDQARFEIATDLLTAGDADVSEVSEFLGYEHPQHFIRAFRRWVGVTPGQYKRIQQRMQ